MDLSNFFVNLADPRRKQGQRYPFEAFLWMIFLSVASGYTSSRKIATFCKAHHLFFTNYFGLEYGVPSHVSVFKLLRDLDNSSFADQFNAFMLPETASLVGDWIAGDGQTLRSTVVCASSSEQNCCSIVSLFCQKTGLTLALTHYLNKKEGEQANLRTLLDNLRNKGVILTLDALHCQKKH